MEQPKVKQCAKLYRERMVWASIGALAAPAVAWSACTITVPPRPVSGQTSWTSTQASQARLNASPLSTEFRFQCDRDTDYQLVLNDTGEASRGFVSIHNRNGEQLSVQPILRSVNGKVENIPFSSLPPIGYQGRAVGGHAYAVAIDFIPLGLAKPGRGIASGGQFAGNIVISLRY